MFLKIRGIRYFKSFVDWKVSFNVSIVIFVIFLLIILFERKVASALFGTPPVATYQDALKYFLQAEKVSPGFWKKNQLAIAECHLKLGDKKEASNWLVSAKKIPVKTEEDQEAENDIIKLLDKV